MLSAGTSDSTRAHHDLPSDDKAALDASSVTAHQANSAQSRMLELRGCTSPNISYGTTVAKWQPSEPPFGHMAATYMHPLTGCNVIWWSAGLPTCSGRCRSPDWRLELTNGSSESSFDTLSSGVRTTHRLGRRGERERIGSGSGTLRSIHLYTKTA